MGRQYRYVSLLGLVGLCALMVSFLSAAKGTNEPPETPSAVPNVARGAVVYGYVDVESRVREVWPKDFPNPSTVTEISPNLESGKRVQKDEVLFRLDDTLARLKIEEAEGGLARAKANVDLASQAKTAHSFAIKSQADIVDAKAFEIAAAQTKLEGVRGEIERRVPGPTLTDLKAGEEQISAMTKAADAERRKLEGLKQVQPDAKVTEAKAAVAEIEKKLEQAKYLLSLLAVKAPCDGTVLRTNVNYGMVLGPQTRTPLLYIIPKEALVVRLEVEQEYAHRIAEGMSAVIYHDNVNDLKWKGKVRSLSNAFLPRRNLLGPNEGIPLSGSDTRVMEAIVTVDLQPGDPPLRIGQKVRVAVGIE